MIASEIVDILILIYFIPVLVLATYHAIKFGIKEYSEWRFLLLLAIFRIVGSSTGIAATKSPNATLAIVSEVFANIGTTWLLAVLLGLASRINSQLRERALNQKLFRMTGVLILVAVVLGAVGGSYLNGDKASLGQKLIQVASVLYWIIFAVAALLCGNGFVSRHILPSNARRLDLLLLASFPFLVVRLVYALCAAFRTTDPDFSFLSTTNTAVIIRALMTTLMEWIIVTIYLVGLIGYQRAEAQQMSRGAAMHRVEEGK